MCDYVYRVIAEVMKKGKIWNKDNVITYNHGRGNNWAMSFSLPYMVKGKGGEKNKMEKGRSPGRSPERVEKKGEKGEPKMKRPHFDNFNFQHFDVHSENQEIVDRSKNKVRKMLEKVSGCPSFFVCAGIAGGTGSGLGSRLLVELRDEFALADFNTFTVFPLLKGETPLQHYNCAFALMYMNEISQSIVSFPITSSIHAINGS